MAIPFFKELRIGGYLIKQKLLGRKRYPLVLMLEPLFRCNLACVGCGKIDYPDAILNRRMTAQECWDAADECGAPMVAIPGGEPLIHKEIGEIVRGLVARKKFVSLCTNALLLEKKLDLFEPSPYLFFSGASRRPEGPPRQGGVAEGRVRPRRLGDQGRESARLHRQRQRHDLRRPCRRKRSQSSSTSPPSSASACRCRRATPMSARPTRSTSSTAPRPRSCSATCSRSARARSGTSCIPACSSTSSPATRAMNARPWGMPARNIFGWQKPCYLLGEGYTKTFKELMETTDWDTYGTGKYEKCADCMAHCGYEPTAANAALTNPLKAMWVALRGVRTTGPMAPEIDLEQAASGAVHLLRAGAEEAVGDPPRRGAGRRRPRRSGRLPRPPERADRRTTKQKGPTAAGRSCLVLMSVASRRSSSDVRRARGPRRRSKPRQPRRLLQRAVEVDAGRHQRSAASAGCARRRAAPCAGRYRRSA